MERSARGIGYLPIRLDDGFARLELLLNVLVDVAKNLGKKGLVGLTESQSIAVPGESVDEILGEVRPGALPPTG